MGSLALKCHFLSLKGAFFQKTESLSNFSSSLSKEKDTKSPLIWHLFLTTNDRGATDLINRNEKSLLGLDYHEFIGKVTSRGLDCYESIGKMTSRDLDCYDSIEKVAGRSLGYHESIGKVTGRGLDYHDSIGKITSRGLDCHETIGKVTSRGLGHYKTFLNTNN